MLCFALLCFSVLLLPFLASTLFCDFPVSCCLALLRWAFRVASLCCVLFRCVALCVMLLRFVSLRCIVRLVCRSPCFVFAWLCFVVFGLLCSSVYAFTLLCFTFLFLAQICPASLFVALLPEPIQTGFLGELGPHKNRKLLGATGRTVKKKPLLGKLIGIENGYRALSICVDMPQEDAVREVQSC